MLLFLCIVISVELFQLWLPQCQEGNGEGFQKKFEDLPWSLRLVCQNKKNKGLGWLWVCQYVCVCTHTHIGWNVCSFLRLSKQFCFMFYIQFKFYLPDLTFHLQSSVPCNQNPALINSGQLSDTDVEGVLKQVHLVAASSQVNTVSAP